MKKYQVPNLLSSIFAVWEIKCAGKKLDKLSELGNREREEKPHGKIETAVVRDLFFCLLRGLSIYEWRMGSRK